jgi:L-rhamnose mutarotase
VIEEYKALHAPGGTWPGVLAALENYNITNYTIHHYPPLQLLIAHFVYIGSEYDADMAAMAADPETQRWWKVTDAMQESFEPGATGSGKDVPWWTVSELLGMQGMISCILHSFRSLRKYSGSRERHRLLCTTIEGIGIRNSHCNERGVNIVALGETTERRTESVTSGSTVRISAKADAEETRCCIQL